MKKIFLFFFLFSFAIPMLSQHNFEFIKSKSNKIKIPFKLINNLVFIPIKVNGVELLFLLDSGVEETILFGFEDPKTLNLNNVVKINIQGFGDNVATEGLKSSGNLLTIGKMQSKDHLLYLILDPTFNISNFVGVTVNGIIGSSVFYNHLVEIDYSKKIVCFHELESDFHKKIKLTYSKVPLLIEKNKPYVNTKVKIKDEEVEVKLLIDSGNSDAVWLFDKLSNKIEIPEKNFKDYLGQGLSGAVEGKRAKINQFSIADFHFSFPVVAFPDLSSIKNITMYSKRLGSLGGEILKRFTTIFDYNNGWLFLKKNKLYKNSFYYNKSGIEVWHTGVQLVKQLVVMPDNSTLLPTQDTKTDNTVSKYKYKVALKPIYEIGFVRENSNAEKSGLQSGDILVSINGKETDNFSLQEINSLLWSEYDIWIELRVVRNGNFMNFKFRLEDVL